jgi:hypothetical protein
LSGPTFDELLRRLTEAGAEFVIVGGLAVNAWGVVRGTKDVDVVVAPANLKRVAEVAVAAGGHVQRGEALLGSPPSIATALASGEQVAIETDLGGLDVVHGLGLEGTRGPGRATGAGWEVCSLRFTDS